MLLLTAVPERRTAPLVAIFGAGLLGAPLAAVLRRRGLPAEHLPLSWVPGARRDDELASVRERMERLSRRPEAAGVAVVWAAGRAGFGASAEQTESELESFLQVLALAESLAGGDGGRVVFHMLSSIGGLFEGQRHVGRTSLPAPRQPYGVLKARQEAALRASRAVMRRRTYRLTSVFGNAGDGSRRGLVSTLLRNAETFGVTRIYGRPSTLRDFVWNVDVARYLAGRVLVPGPGEAVVETLASGKPSSIHEVVAVVEASLGRRLYVQYGREPANATDITVSPSLHPRGWMPTDLRTAIRLLCGAGPARA